MMGWGRQVRDIEDRVGDVDKRCGATFFQALGAPQPACVKADGGRPASSALKGRSDAYTPAA